MASAAPALWPGAAVAGPASDPDGWTVYHHDPAGSGLVTKATAIDTSTRAWTSPVLDGELYGEPLVSAGHVYVATENDTVYSLSAANGTVVWSTHLASPVPASSLPCGDIQPTVGITGTPVIDPMRGEIFAVADEVVRGQPAHVLVGLSLATGRLEMSQNVDPPGADAAALLQRTGLALDEGKVVFGFGGNDGDCASYRGRVVAVGETGGTPSFFTVDAATGDSQGAIWMGGAAPAVDATGNLWVEAGNGSVYSSADGYDDSDSVLELSPSLRLEQYFAPASWPANNVHDLDMSMSPALLSDGEVVVAGKSRIAYLVDGAHLGGVGGQEAALASICSQDVDGGSATVGTTVYLPCLSGTVALRVDPSPPSLRVLWSSGLGGGPPIVAAGLVWTIAQNGDLYGLDPDTGTARQQASIGVASNHFPTPSVGDGLLLATGADQVVAFDASGVGTSGSSPSPKTSRGTVSNAPSTTVATPATAGGGGIPPGGVVGIVVGGTAVIAAVAWLGWIHRRRTRARGGP
jgi:outer membrane protein assembly factor BamB